MIILDTARHPPDISVPVLSIDQLTWLEKYCNNTHMIIEMEGIFDAQTFMYKSRVYISFENTGDEVAFNLKFGNTSRG